MNAHTSKVVIIGGSGLWTEQNHIPNIVSAKKIWPFVRVAGICDIVNPYSTSKWLRPGLHNLLLKDKPTWLPVESFNKAATKELAALHATQKLDLMIIACSPTLHFEYAKWALENGISVICDKPLVDVANAASDSKRAKKIVTNYEHLIMLYRQAKKKIPYLTFSLILRRRSLPAFNIAAERLAEVSRRYGAGINHINILHHNGIYKYPEEMMGTGAHHFSAGVGSLSHTSYHYIDLLNQYLHAAGGGIKYIIPKLTNVFRVGDYLNSRGYEQIAKINGHVVADAENLPKSVLASELDFAFHLDFFDNANKKIGDGNFMCNHLSFSPRTHGVEVGVLDPANFMNGGRMSHLCIDIHQSGLQNISIAKNDIASQKSQISLQMRTHPKIDLPDNESIYFANAYNDTSIRMGDMFNEVLSALIKKEALVSKMVVDAEEDFANVKMFARFYELIARSYERGDNHNVTDDAISLG